VRYGFVIDQRACIGCHACTVACKEENQVPLGAFRTWVKYVERGVFPHTRRFFAVLRCNHCDEAPCVAICPTVALYRRPDGIVDFDRDRCIGCKSCLQGCPYDALYIDPATGTAAKCHYCAHRVEVGLQPACVIVCPEQAIVAGDLDDPGSPIARLVAREPLQVRKPEQGTRPKVFYVGAEAAALTPSLQAPAPAYLWAERPALERTLVEMVAALHGRDEAALARPVYDAPHAPRPWGFKVGAYLWTKAIAAGTLLLAAAAVLLGRAEGGWLSGLAAPALALLFLALTGGLLVADLKRPERFPYLFLKGNRRSWLVLGAWILLGYGAIGTLWLLAGVTGRAGALSALAWPTAVLALAAAGYSAFLFGQAEGRDFWQSPLTLPHLLAGAVLAGSAALILAEAAHRRDADTLVELGLVLAAALVVNAGLLLADLLSRHPSVDAARAARLVTHGHFRRRFWGGVVAAGTALPLGLIALGPGGVAPAAVLALAGLWLWEDLWVTAGQAIPLS
jgi:Fe-S-cluster-containing dehydrogenase component/formate-dependent nitrite reductase membrane component NrfD